MTGVRAWTIGAGAVGVAAVGGYLGLVSGAVPVDVGVGRRTRPLGPVAVEIGAPRELVFELLTAPYAERAPRAMREKVQILERGADLLLAAHKTPLRGGLTATTVETVKLLPPHRVEFRLVRGPVPHVVEAIDLEERAESTVVHYTGELGTDLWALGERWGDLVAKTWVATVEQSLATVKAEAERRS
jgi:uncharacterized protein YndB with AHSA1/START domain